MMDQDSDKYLNDPTFQSVLVACLEKLERGEQLDRNDVLNGYPDYADALDEFLADQALLKRVAGQVRDSFSRHDIGDVSSSPIDETIDSHPRSNDFSTGDRIRYIGEYEILEEIARGGMGVVFKARQQKLQRVVALKMILAGRLADAADVERFHREARWAGRLKHSNIVPVHDVGEHEGRHYFTMDFVAGRSLGEVIRDETLAPRKAAQIVRTTAEAVQYAHAQGIVHRDLKPANVLLDSDNQPHVTDFGLARMLESVDEASRAELTASGQILGTPSYMSPEQAAGKQDLVGPAADIYSLGAILYACLTGRAPFVADSPVDTLLQVMKNEPVSPRALNPSVPKDLETICLKCLAKERHKRYGTAQELADDLKRFLEGRPVVARPVGAISRTVRWCRRNRAVAALLCLLFLSMAAGTYVSAGYAITAIRHAESEARQRVHAETVREEADEQRRKAELARHEAETQRDVATKAKAQAERSLSKEAEARRESELARRAEANARRAVEGALVKAERARQEAEVQRTQAQWQTYVARLQPMMYRWEQQEYGQLESMLDLAIPSAESKHDFRGWEWFYLRNLCRQRTAPVDEASTFSSFFDWHADTKRLAVFRSKRLEIWSGAPPRFQSRIDDVRPGTIRFSPDGTHLAVVDKLIVQIVSVGSGKTVATIDVAAEHTTNRDSKQIMSLDWRTDGTALATGTNMGAIHLWNRNSGELIKPITTLPHNFPCNDMNWHPEEELLAVGVRYGLAMVVNVERDQLAWSRKIHRDYVLAVRWNPSGDLLAAATAGGSDPARLVIWDREGTERMRSAKGALSGKPSVAWMDDENLVVATSDQDIHQFQLDSDKPTKTIRVHALPVERILHYGDGQRVISSTNEEIRTTRIGSDVLMAAATPVHKFGIKAISWCPDSRRVATVSWDGIVAITDVLSSKVIHELAGHKNGAVNDVAWSPDGLRVASCDHGEEFRIWDPDAGKLLNKFIGGRGSGGFNSLTWIDNQQIAGGHERIRIYDVNNGESTKTISDSKGHFACLAYCPKSNLVAHIFANGGNDSVCDLQGKERFRINHETGRGAAWSPDGKILATGGKNGIVIIDAIAGKFLTTIRGHAGAVTDVCFSPDGSRVASSSRDGTVRVWDRATGAELLILKHHDVIAFNCLAWSPDGTTIAAAAEGLIVAWHASLPAGAGNPSSLTTGIIASVKSPADEIAELTEALEDAPTDVVLLRERGDLHAAQLMWNEALADYQRVLEIKTNYSWEAVSAARAALMLGDREEYRRRIAVLVERFLKPNASDYTATDDYVASTAALAPHADFDLSKLLSRSRAHSDAKGRALWASRGVILLQLRLRNDSEVLKRIDRHQGDLSANYRIFLAAARALAHHQSGNTDAAEDALASARDLADKTWFPPAEGKAISYSDTGIFVEASVLLEEVKKNIRDSKDAEEDASSPAEQQSEPGG